MSLKLRLALLIGGAFLAVWAFSAVWLLQDLRTQLSSAQDNRLAASAAMVAGLFAQQPALRGVLAERPLTSEDLDLPRGLACQIVAPDTPAARPAPLLQNDRTGFREQTLHGEAWRSYTMVQDGLRITTADRIGERRAMLASQWRPAALPVLLALPVSLALLWGGICKGLAPLSRLRAALARRRPQSREPLPEQDLPSELAPFVSTLNELFGRIGETLEREARFTSNAAHELRTPLTAIKTHIQVARMCEGDTASFSLAQAEAAADQMQHTLSQLLMLARVESAQDWPAEPPVRIAPLVAELRARLPNEAQLLVQDFTAPARGLALPKELAAIALRNLLDNAVHHSPPDTPVELLAEDDEAGIRLSVRDRGPGVPDELLPLLGERFRRRGDYPGTGLGLALARAIATRAGGSLRFENADPGLRALLALPAANHRLAPGTCEGGACEDEDAAEHPVLQQHEAGALQQRTKARRK